MCDLEAIGSPSIFKFRQSEVVYSQSRRSFFLLKRGKKKDDALKMTHGQLKRVCGPDIMHVHRLMFVFMLLLPILSSAVLPGSVSNKSFFLRTRCEKLLAEQVPQC